MFWLTLLVKSLARRFISLGDIFHASASQLGRKYTFKDIPKDCFQFQVDLLLYSYLTRLFNFFCSNRAFVRFYVLGSPELEGMQLLDGFTTKLIRTDGSRSFHAQEYAVTF